MHGKKSKQTDARKKEKPDPSKRIPIASIVSGKVSMPSMDEFQKLIQYDGELGQRFTTAQGMRYNKTGQFNLIPTNLPFDHNRIVIRKPIQGCDYINANWISPPSDDSATYDELIYTSYLPYSRIQFAVGQEPLPHTESMHYRMIHEQKFNFVISFTQTPKEELFEVDELRSFTGLNLHVLSRTQINEHLYRSEISLINGNNSNTQYTHNFIYFEFDSWPTEETSSSKEIELLVSSMCLIRNEMTLNKSSLRVLVTDYRGGVGASAVFLAMYETMQDVDEAFTHDNQLKQSAKDIDVFSIVNRLRKDRDKMIEDFANYQLIFKCLGYYGLNHKTLIQLKRRRNFGEDRANISIVGEKSERNFRHTIIEGQASNDEIEYVIDGEEGEGNDELEDCYLTRNLDTHHKYQNIEEMSEYL